MTIIPLEKYILNLDCDPITFQEKVLSYTYFLNLELHPDMFIGETPLFLGFTPNPENSDHRYLVFSRENWTLKWNNYAGLFYDSYHTISDLVYYSMELNPKALSERKVTFI